jgi:hypothetical protein
MNSYVVLAYFAGVLTGLLFALWMLIRSER